MSSSLDKQDILFLSSRIVKIDNGIQLDQQPYALDLIDRNGLSEANSTRVAIAADQGMQGQVSESHEEEVDSLMSETVREAQRMAGELLWLSQRTRPDLAYAVNVACSTALNDPSRSIRICKGVLRYLRGTANKSLMFFSKMLLMEESRILTRNGT